MQIIDKNIDEGKPFDWGNVSFNYENLETFIQVNFIKK